LERFAEAPAWTRPEGRDRSALARLEARLLLVDHVDAAAAAHDLAALLAELRGLERVDDFHRILPWRGTVRPRYGSNRKCHKRARFIGFPPRSVNGNGGSFLTPPSSLLC